MGAFASSRRPLRFGSAVSSCIPSGLESTPHFPLPASATGGLFLSARAGRRAALSAVALGAIVVGWAAFASRSWLLEVWNLRKLEEGSPEERARALAALLETGSPRAMPYLVRQVLDPALGKSLHATVDAMPQEGDDSRWTGDEDSASGGARVTYTIHFSSFDKAKPFAGVDREAVRFIDSPRLRPSSPSHSPTITRRSSSCAMAPRSRVFQGPRRLSPIDFQESACSATPSLRLALRAVGGFASRSSGQGLELRRSRPGLDQPRGIRPDRRLQER